MERIAGANLPVLVEQSAAAMAALSFAFHGRTRMTTHAAARTLLACATLLAAATTYAQQDYPTKPIVMLIPFAAGGGNDVVGRIVGAKAAEHLGQRIVPENRTGASGNIAIEATKRAAPDGYTVVVASTSMSVNMYTAKVNYTLADFTPVAQLGRLPFTLMVAPSVPARNMKELVALAKAKPGQFNSATGTTGMGFFLTEVLKRSAGLDIQAVPYKGAAAGVTDVLADRTQLLFGPISTTMPHARAGKATVVGVTGTKRSELMPEVPTFIEQGHPRLDIPSWFGLIGPASIPAPRVKILADAMAKALAAKDVIDALGAQGVEPAFGTAAELDKFMKADAAMWSKLVQELGIKPQ